MKKGIVLIIIFIIFVVAIVSFLIFQRIGLLSKPEGITEGVAGPAGCKTNKECEQYCTENIQECEEWCQENPIICEEILNKSKNEGFLEIFEEGFSGPGGCKGPDCEQYCQQNPQECMKWCQENPELCNLFIGGGTSEIVKPPVTTINFAKTVNVNADLFTKEDIIKAKKLGANMMTIWPARMIKDDEFIFFPERVASSINFAHQNGLQVELRSSFAGGIPTNYKKFKANALEHVAEFAKFAEKYEVYRIVPFGEVDNDLLENCNEITEFAQEILQEMRKHYSGQIGIGIVGSWRDCGYTFNGYDYLTVSAYPQTQIGIDKWLTPKLDVDSSSEDALNLAFITKWAREVADRSGISTLHIGEIAVQNIGEKDPSGFFQTVEVSKEKEAEFYEKVFFQISDKVNGTSVFYNSKTSFMSINGDPAEDVVKEWFEKL